MAGSFFVVALFFIPLLVGWVQLVLLACDVPGRQLKGKATYGLKSVSLSDHLSIQQQSTTGLQIV